MSDPNDFSMANPNLHQSLDGHAFIMDDRPQYTGPSLEGPVPSYGGPRGIGGSVVGSDGASPKPPPPVQAPRQMTPDELMAAANAMGNQMAMEHQGRMAMGPAVSPEPSGPPDWLQKYMSSQPFTDPYHQEPVRGVDMNMGKNYLSEREKLRYLKRMAEN